MTREVGRVTVAMEANLTKLATCQVAFAPWQTVHEKTRSMAPLFRLLSPALLLAAALAAAPEDAVIRPGAPLFDTNGDRLYAGGANLWL